MTQAPQKTLDQVKAEHDKKSVYVTSKLAPYLEVLRDLRWAIPTHMRASVGDYLIGGVLAESHTQHKFLEAVFAGDLFEAETLADSMNRERLHDYANLIRTHFPHQCWGSYDLVDAWVKNKGLRGRYEREYEGENNTISNGGEDQSGSTNGGTSA